MTKLVVSLPEKDNEFQLLQAVDARVAAKRLGFEVEMLYASNSGMAQIHQLYKAIHGDPRPSALVVEPIASGSLEVVLRKAAERGIGAAVLNCTVDYVSRLRVDFPQLPFFTVGSNQVEIGSIQGEQLRALLPEGGTVLYLHGPSGAVAADERFRGLKTALEGTAIRLIVLDGQWTEESACRSVQSWLRLKSSATLGIDAVAAQDDSMARGARRALEAAGLPAIPFLGIDGVPDVGQRLVDALELTATIVMPSNSGPAIDHLGRWLGAGVMPPASVRLAVEPYPATVTLGTRSPNGPPRGGTGRAALARLPLGVPSRTP
jgi:ribose transport system substrate-binding protein